MVKINKEEYEVLKGLDIKWKWIARDGNYGGSIFCYEEKPYKHIKRGGWAIDTEEYQFLDGCESLFQFIQWTDVEPTCIQELIEEYESEESEVKDIKWLREQIKNEMNSWELGNPDYFRGAEDAYENMKDWLNQLDEPEINQLKDKIKELDDYNSELIRDNNQLRNALDEPGVLSQDWIDEHEQGDWGEWVYTKDLNRLLVPKHPTVEVQELINKYSIDTMSTYDVKVEREKFVKDLQNLLVPNQELPVIPQWVADDIESKKRVGTRLNVAMSQFPEFKLQKEMDINENECNKVYARAWLDGYEVKQEQEQKFYLIFPNIDNQGYKYTFIDMYGEFDTGNYKKQIIDLGKKFTEQEIEGFDPNYMHFAVKIEELEE